MKSNDIESRQDYLQYIEEMADVITEEWDNYPEDNDDKHHDVDMTIDSDPLIMYYDKNLKVLEHSPNEPSEWKHMVSDSDGYRKVIQVMTYDVMRQDLYEELHNRGYL